MSIVHMFTLDLLDHAVRIATLVVMILVLRAIRRAGRAVEAVQAATADDGIDARVAEMLDFSWFELKDHVDS